MCTRFEQLNRAGSAGNGRVDSMDHRMWVIGFLGLMSPCLLAYTEPNDPVLKYMCSSEFGGDFWSDLLQCTLVLNSKFSSAMASCIPASNEGEAESTRTYICSSPEKWVKMMDCVNMHLIESQDQKNPTSEIGPGALYRTCISFLMGEAAHSEKTGEPFLGKSSRESGS